MSQLMRVTMELCSDAIFGSGYSTPGGEDIAISVNERGYPVLSGSAVKGLLRESLEHYLAWTARDASLVRLLMGEEGWSEADDGRRIHLSDFTMEEPPLDPGECFVQRSFTSVEEWGVAADGSLRTASCITRGARFTGELVCDPSDVALLTNAFKCVKWAGRSRSRGFGRVKWRLLPQTTQPPAFPVQPGGCLRYRLQIESGVIITDKARSADNVYETKQYIPGSAIRGAVIGGIKAKDPAWFEAHKKELLSIRFQDAVPNPGGQAAIPVPMGFYAQKDGSGFTSVLYDGELDTGLKRAKLGAFCTLSQDTITHWNGKTDGTTRIQRNVTSEEDTRPFSVRYICKGQTMEGSILTDNEEMMRRIAEVLSEELWIGADRFEGFGRCSIESMTFAQQPAWIEEYGCKESELSQTLFLLAVSPFTMLNEAGEPCGLNVEELAKRLGVDWVEVRLCATSVTEYDGYNRTWQSRSARLRMYERGSIFKLSLSQVPSMQRVEQLMQEGLGVRKPEGFGQILIMGEDRYLGLTKTKAVTRSLDPREQEQMLRRRARIEWIRKNRLEFGTSRTMSYSQIGTLDQLCLQALGLGSDAEIRNYLNKNVNERDPRDRDRFKKTAELVLNVLDQPAPPNVCGDQLEDKLKLLRELFSYSRSIQKEGRK